MLLSSAGEQLAQVFPQGENHHADPIRITHGSNDSFFPNIVGKSIASIKRSLATVFSIPDDAQAFISGSVVAPEYRVRAGDSLVFWRTGWGRKGALEPEELARIERLEERLAKIERMSGTSHSEPTTASRNLEEIMVDLPKEVTTEEAAKILGQCKDTVLRFREAGLLEFRNAAPPGSSRPVYRFLLESVLKLRTSYETDEPTPDFPREPSRRQAKGKRMYKYIDYD